MQLPVFPPASDWRPPNLSDLPSWKDAGRVAVDVETCDPLLHKLGPGVRRGAYMCGVAFAIEDGPAHYLPFAHLGGDNLDPDKVLAYLCDQAAVFTGDLAGAGMQYDLDHMAQAGIVFKPRMHRDVQVAEPLLDELQHVYGLDAIAERRGVPGKDETHLREAAEAFGVHPKRELWKLPARHVGAYAERDVRLPLLLLRRQEREIEEQGLWPIYDLESRVLPALLAMRRRGVRIDFDALDRVERRCLKQEVLALHAVKAATGVALSPEHVWKPKALLPALRMIGVEPPRTPKTGAPSITAAFLGNVDHDVARMLVRARQMNKVRTTFVESIRRHETGGRVHTTFNQLRRSRDDEESGKSVGAAYGRLSSADPNMQQQPARHPELGRLWRSIYVPDDDAEWACLDFSQQEPRWLTHYAELARCLGAKAAADAYRNDPTTDNHQMMADLCSLPRKQAKNIFLGKCYGMGGAKLCRELGLPTEWVARRGGRGMIEVAGPEGHAIIEQFDSEVPYVRQLERLCSRTASERGYIRTHLGRRCRFPPLKGGGYDWTHKALNRLVQGTAADHTKKAVVDAHEAGFPIQLQVHDELDLSIGDRSQAFALAELMRDCVECQVPHVVDVEIGPSWGRVEAVA